MKNPDRETVSSLEALPNIGKAIAKDLRLIEIEKPQDLIGEDPLEMYNRLCVKKAQKIDYCVLDVFMSAVDFMEGSEAQEWWHYTNKRKEFLKNMI